MEKFMNKKGDNSDEEKFYVSNRIENEDPDKPFVVKTAKELAMEGKIAWDKSDKTKESETKNLTDEEKIRVEFRKTGMSEEGINNLLEKRKKKENPTIEGQNAVPNGENKEKYSREELLNAAEIFCKFNSATYYKDLGERRIAEERALINLKSEHSEREIDAAMKVSGKRKEMADIREQVLQIKEEYKDAMDRTSVGTLVVKDKYKQQMQDIKEKMQQIDVDYQPLFIELGVANLDNQLKNTEKYRDTKNYGEEIKNANLSKLSMLQTEKMRYQDAKVSAGSAMNPTAWDWIKRGWKRTTETKLFQGYAKMGRGSRLALGAAIVGAGTALWLPASVALGAGGAVFIGCKMARSIAGGTFGYNLSKRLFQPMVKKSRDYDDNIVIDVRNTESLISEEMDHFTKLAKGEAEPTDREKILHDLAVKDAEILDKHNDKFIKNQKRYVRNNVIIGGIVPGLLGGGGATLLTDWVAGPGMLNMFPTHGIGTGATKEAIFDNNTPKTGSVINEETLKLATAGKRGIEGAVRDQLENDPAKFGFKGDIADKIAVHEWSGPKADLIAIDNNYKGGGTETWVRDMGEPGLKGNPAYPIDIDANGKITIQEYIDGKPSGTGGLNSPYEYEHTSPTPKRYVSALENTPDEYNGPNKLTEYEEVVITPEGNIGGSKLTEYEEFVARNTPENVSIKNEPLDISKTQAQPVEKIIDSNNIETATSLKPNFSVQEQMNDVYTKNIQHLFPEDTVGEWSDARTLPVDQLMNSTQPGRFTGLVDHLHQLEKVTGLKPHSSLIDGHESVYKYVNRALQDAANKGRLSEVTLGVVER